MPATEVINFDHIFKSIGQRIILKDINLTVNQGDIFGFLGPNGAGKTTSIRIALGLLHPTSGTAAVFGHDPEDGTTRRRIGFVLDVDGFYNDLTAQDNLVYYAKLYRISNPAEKIAKNIKLAGLTDRVNDKVGSYSKGMRQRLSLARTLLHDPELLVLDEPTAGVDPTGQIEMRQILLDMAHQQNKTIFFSSHNLDEVQRICNRIALIDRGEIRLSGELAEIEHSMGHGEMEVETTEAVPSEVVADLKMLAGVTILSQREQILRLSITKSAEIPAIVHLLDSRGVKVEQVKKLEASLEEVYTAILKEGEARQNV
jgi:ABC-2 type transport system ATP-binding protein